MGIKITGVHAIEEALKDISYGSTLYVIRGEKRNINLEKLALSTGRTVVKKVTEEQLNKISGSSSHRGAVLDCGASNSTFKGGKLKEIKVPDFISGLRENENYLVLALDSITDPYNLGAILRSADQFSADLILIPERRSASVNETVIRVSSGSAQYVYISYVVNLANELENFKKHGFWIYGADMNGSNSYTSDFSKKSVIVMGSEGTGIRPLVKSKCDFMVSIPMYGHIDSLNVSVSAGIMMYEYRRKYTK